MKLDEVQITKKIKDYYGLSDEEVDEALKDSKISNKYSALVQLNNLLSSNIDNEIIATLRRQVKIGRNLFAKGVLILSEIEVSKGRTIEINNSNLNKILELSLGAERMIRTGSGLEIEALKEIKALQG